MVSGSLCAVEKADEKKPACSRFFVTVSDLYLFVYAAIMPSKVRRALRSSSTNNNGGNGTLIGAGASVSEPGIVG